MPKRDTAIYLEGQRDLMRALRRLPPSLESAIREASGDIARDAVRAIAGAASTRAERKAARSVRVRAGRDPRIAAGGGARTEGGPMFFGTEFGGGRNIRTRQFRPHRGTRGYWFYPTIRAQGRRWAERWLDAIDDTTRKHWRNR